MSRYTTTREPTRGGRAQSLTISANFKVALETEETLTEGLARCIVTKMMERPPRGGDVVVDSTLLDSLSDTAVEDLRLVAPKKVRTPPVGETWDPKERWRKRFRCKWRRPAHNNLLELQSALQAIRHLGRSLKNWGHRVLLLTDSQVVLGALMKGRSSAGGILRGCRQACALLFGYSLTLICRYIPTDRNHADGPSRGGPLGVMPKSRSEPIRFGPWYQRGSTLVSAGESDSSSSSSWV